MDTVKPPKDGYRPMGSEAAAATDQDLSRNKDSNNANFHRRRDWRFRKSRSAIDHLGLQSASRSQESGEICSTGERQWSGVSPRGIQAPVIPRSGVQQTVHHLSEHLYSKFEAEKLPNFFSKLRIDPDGGLDRIQDLWHPDRVLWFLFLIASVVFNFWILCHANWSVFENLCQDLLHGKAIEAAAETSDEGVSTIDVRDIKVGGEMAQQAIANNDMFQYIDPRVRMRLMSIAVAVSFFEICGLFFYLLSLALDTWRFNFGGGRFHQFRSVIHLFLVTLPNLQNFSGIKLFAYVHPSLVYSMYLDFMRESDIARNGQVGFCLALSWFVVTRILCGTFSVLAFAIKLLAVAFKLAHPLHGWWLSWLYAIALMNQCMGVVLLEQVLQDRVFLFIFGGSDAFFQDEERALFHVYHVRVAEAIWEQFWRAGEKWKCVCLLATLDHYDLQALILDIDGEDCTKNLGSNFIDMEQMT